MQQCRINQSELFNSSVAAIVKSETQEEQGHYTKSASHLNPSESADVFTATWAQIFPSYVGWNLLICHYFSSVSQCLADIHKKVSVWKNTFKRLVYDIQ